MTPEGAANSTGEGGQRERKRLATRERIIEAGLRLFLADGFDATTVDAVAAEAGIARRSFFHHFRSKEDILLAWQADHGGDLSQAVTARPAHEAPLEAARQALLEVAGRYTSDQMVAIDRLMRSSHVLQSRKQASYVDQERVMFEALATRWPDPALTSVLRHTAMAAVGVMRLALKEWNREGFAQPIALHMERGFVSLEAAVVPRRG